MLYRYIILVLIFTAHSIAAFAQAFPEKEILKLLDADKIVAFEGTNNIYKVRSKKTKKWGVYEVSEYEDHEFTAKELIPFSFEEINKWFNDFEPFVTVKNNGKLGVLLNPYEIPFELANIRFVYEAIELVHTPEGYFAVAQKNGKWGLIDWFEGYEISDFKYTTIEEVPLSKVESWQVAYLQVAKKLLKTDIIVFDMGNEDGVFKAQHTETHKWGMYQMLSKSELVTLIPMEYDSMKFFSFNGLFTVVYNNGKLGIYTSYFSFGDEAKQTVRCEYDAYKTYSVEGKYGTYLALKKGDGWGWVNWITGEEQSEFTYNLEDGMPYPYYQQEY